MKKGFTLIELLTLLIILTILTTITINVFDNTDTNVLKDKDHIERKILP
jgi:prepilin-type N-terminal cleavage/methylation domain-containing protein